MKKILVTGANGQLGRSLKEVAGKLQDQQLQFVFMDREQLDITRK
ncbi:MAG: sugar nucleotide-binding protein, partial [Weeksellaceae bacterium]|nr:sugar nucleotide-binding protein [Weeksellaceae bacterium]